MAGLPDVIGLLYRADWTRLSLSAEVRFDSDGDLLRRRVRERWSRSFRSSAPGQAAACHQFGPLARGEAMVRVSAQAEVP